ncbi:UNVERIFIED_CONTAM: hypothetical protein Sangu_2533400 [Sesamum angustifolium]|uniref:Reverse transcriptase zinc-binding domain-containing protein n=1 Tax=Sesamum angustifolium TaxID=2727405 RepID=A0AAW2JAA9_9LAMI
MDTYTMEPVRYYWHEGDWNVPRIFRIIPMPFAQTIYQIPITASQGDKIVWTGSSTGDFSMKSAWEAIRQASPWRQLLANIWHRSLRPTISVFLWRFFQDRIPVDARMRQKGFSFPSKCQCCEAEETVSHLFIESAAVQGVWQHFAAVFGLCLCDTGSLTHMRNAAKYRGVPFSTDGIILEVQRHLRTLDQCAGRAHSRLAGDGVCPDHGLAPLVVEVDTTTVISLLKSRASGKWEVQHMIMRIMCLQQLLVADVQHVFREANGAVDHLTKEAAPLQLNRVLHHDDITGSLRGILCLDKQGVPHLRRG